MTAVQYYVNVLKKHAQDTFFFLVPTSLTNCFLRTSIEHCTAPLWWL